jgi:hypothetical protein
MDADLPTGSAVIADEDGQFRGRARADEHLVD